MDLIVNHLSFHGQISGEQNFRDAVNNLMTIRKIVEDNGCVFFSHAGIFNCELINGQPIAQSVHSLSRNERAAFTSWLTKRVWQSFSIHSPNDYFECLGQVVTDSGVAEAAICCMHGIHRGVASISNSNWLSNPLDVLYDEDKNIPISNFWDAQQAADNYSNFKPDISSWDRLESISKIKFKNINFIDFAFDGLLGMPFFQSASDRIYFIFSILDEYKTCFDSSGARTARGNEIYQNYFVGSKGGGGKGSLFSDSSDSEKNDFSNEMTFTNPVTGKKDLFCPWHGKVQTPKIRVHFSYPITSTEPLYIAYVGDKLTKR